MYANRKNITMINAIKRAWGAERTAQTNSRYDGNYISAVRLYDAPGDKGHADRAIVTIRTESQLLDAYNQYCEVKPCTTRNLSRRSMIILRK
jgi:hypothetical protein